MTLEEEASLLDFDKLYSGSSLPSLGAAPTEEVVRYVRSNAGDRCVLDLGCGDGRNSLFMAAAGYTVIAVDSSPAGIEKLTRMARARGLDERLAGVVADVRDLPFLPELFDLVVAVTIIDHLPDHDIDALLERMIGALKPGGSAVIQVHTIGDPGYRDPRANVASELASEIRHYFDYDELRARLTDRLRVEHYDVRMEYDTSHGRPHYHGFAIALGVRGAHCRVERGRVMVER
jgi:cyclopropane fatty-acyl-phospholipid synthase-like methyltransferase